MQLVNSLTRNIQIIALAVFVILAIFAAIGFLIYKKAKVVKNEEDIDYAEFKRTDSGEYVKFDDITDDMLVANEGKRFIGAIKCQGFDYADAEAEEKLQTMRGYITFFNVIDKNPIQFRQSAREVNLDYLIDDYRAQLTKMQEHRFTLNLDYTELKGESEQENVTPEEYDMYYSKLKEMQQELISLEYQAAQLDAQIQYMLHISGDNADSDREQMYIFDWNYDAMDFSSQTLSKEEIYQRAKEQLNSKGNSYIQALRNCGVHAKRMSAVQMLEEIRRYTHPVSAAKGTEEDIKKMAYDHICVTSDSLQLLEKEVGEQMVQEILEGMSEEEKAG